MDSHEDLESQVGSQSDLFNDTVTLSGLLLIVLTTGFQQME